MARKFVQIAVDDEVVFALCNDGSVWWKGYSKDEWRRLPDCPQDGYEEERPRHVNFQTGMIEQ
jgi:hypothetical protein